MASSPSASESASPSTSPSTSPSASPSPSPGGDLLEDVLDFYVVGDQITTDFPYEFAKVVTNVANGASSFDTDLTSLTSSYCVGSYLKFASGALINQTRRISAYNGTSKIITVSAAFTATPTADDEFYIVNQ